MLRILIEFSNWLFSPGPLLASLFLVILVASGLGVAYSAHMTRNMYRDLQALEKDHDDLEHEYERLLLEQSAWADYTRLDQLARDELAMSVPTPEDTVVLK